MSNYWDDLSATDENAASYMLTYGEGPGCDTRLTIGSFINEGESVLDVGCGPGWNFDHFREYGPRIGRYLGLDYSERFVRVANERFLQTYGNGASRRMNDQQTFPFKKGDVRNIQQPDKSWDVVLLQDVLEHTNGYEIPVKEAIRVACKRVIITFWHLIEAGEHINDDGKDGWGAWYERGKWEKFLDDLKVNWLHTESAPEANRQHDFYIIDLEKK